MGIARLGLTLLLFALTPKQLDHRARQLEQEARHIAHSGGCARVDQCALAEVGARACGGAREFLAYCTVTTEAARLEQVLSKQREAEAAWLKATHAMSPCIMPQRPTLTLVRGRCVAR